MIYDVPTIEQNNNTPQRPLEQKLINHDLINGSVKWKWKF